MSGVKGILYFLFFCILLPGELLIWGKALDLALAGSYLSKRLHLSLLSDFPPELFLAAGVLALAGMIRAFAELNRNSHICDSLLYGGFPLYMLSLFLYFKQPCAMAFGIPLICLTEAAVWFAYRPAVRSPFLLPAETVVSASLMQRLAAFFQLVMLFLIAGLVFQEGYLFWFSFPWTPLLPLLPLLGVLLPKPGQIREYTICSVYALGVCGLIYGSGQLFGEGVLLGDFGIIVAYIFLELVYALMIRPLLPPIRNSSLLILGLSSLLTSWLMPPLCSPWIVTMSMYVLYLFIDNRLAIRKKLFSRAHFRYSQVHILTWEEYAAQAWGFGALLAAYLTGPALVVQVLIALAAVLMGGMIRSRLQCNPLSDHIVLRNFPYIIEFTILLLSVSVSSFSRETIMILLCAFAAVSCLMQMVWSIGGLIGKYSRNRPSLLFFQICSYGGMCFLLVLMFFVQAPASVQLGCFCVLSGIVRIGSASYSRNEEPVGLPFGWVLIVIGQFIFVSSPDILLPFPEWSSGAVVCALMACAALYIYRLYDFCNRKRRKPDYET